MRGASYAWSGWLAVALVVLAHVLQSLSAGAYHGGARLTAYPKHVLVLTAHPDDECMFFAPTIHALLAHNVTVSALCLSRGDADGLGHVRAQELVRSYGVLGVPAKRVACVDDPHLQDGMQRTWAPARVRDAVRTHMNGTHIDTILTFDAGGVSLHPNHRALFHGAVQLQSELATPLSLWTLHTWSWRIKFWGVLVSVLQRGGRDYVFRSSMREYAQSLQAMYQHQTQLVWFRYLYVLFSSYMYANRVRLVVQAL
ncbi:N-acetylglucosaminylphosphatidylinositol deacetylase [Malassezia caprae]|uniref:N-acetylglucosaminylphosphatidylinositol deacetylase n=1 Tax=Malassezia caprae TaxID=1381934 RepID=A0AAF0IUZ5_9BASI|nr:N-acetylglucosaminylphosphatidylinositol deacetylase [Malassezia caprae]